jgi:hypothetical protein
MYSGYQQIISKNTSLISPLKTYEVPTKNDGIMIFLLTNITIFYTVTQWMGSIVMENHW